LLAFGLRVYQLDHFSFWLDEGLTPYRSGYAIAEILSNRITIQEGVSYDTHPPLYYLLIHFSRQAWGESDFAYRYFSVLCGLLTIPVLYKLGWRLHGRRLGALAAVLMAINPLQIWYAQEARMYALLVLLALLSSYLLWRTLTHPALSERRLWRSAALYGLLAALMVYTHYAAVFLVGAQGLFWLALLWRRGHYKLIGMGATLLAATAVPLIPYTVPRLFAGVEANYFYIPPWTMLRDVTHGFAFGVTADDGRRLITLLELATAAMLLAGLFYLGRGRQRPAFLLTYLLAVVVGLALGSLLKPMYLGVRHIMIGSPAFYLLVAGGVLAVGRWGGRPALLLALGPTLLAPLWSLHNLYHDGSYAKDNIREMVFYMDVWAGQQDVVVYNNAILLPLHFHYSRRPDVTATAVPIYPHPADERTEAQLAALAADYRRVWFVPDPPFNDLDAAGLAAGWLESHAVRWQRQHFHGPNLLAAVALYQTAEPFLFPPPLGMTPLTAVWDSAHLVGWRPQFEPTAVGPRLWFTLVWDGRYPLPADGTLTARLTTADGVVWASYEQPLRPAAADDWLWPGVGWAQFDYSLHISPGTPPGLYRLSLHLDDPAASLLLTELTIRPESDWPFAPPALPHPWASKFE
jgi:hypothetical protein